MKILVSVKRVIDYNVQIQVKPDGSGVETDQVKMSLNPFDEIAVEAAVSMHESGLASEIQVISVGSEACVDVLRQAMAMGAHSACLVKTDLGAHLEPLMVAKVLAKHAHDYQPDMIVMGKQAIDDDCNQTGQMLAELLQWPQATFASEIEDRGTHVIVTREVDGGLETIEVAKPCVVTVDLRLNTPRYVTLPNILQAKSKPLTSIDLEVLLPDLVPKLVTTVVESPAKREQGVVFDDYDDFIKAIKDDGVL